MPVQRKESELLFDQYVAERGYLFESQPNIPGGKTKKLYDRVLFDGLDVCFEVKEFADGGEINSGCFGDKRVSDVPNVRDIMDAMNGSAKTYLKVVIEDDPHEDVRQAYHAYCPALEEYGASTWGNTKEEALQHIQEVVQMIVQELSEEGVLFPEGLLQDVEVFSEPRVAVTV